jgi:hypothetical protein
MAAVVAELAAELVAAVVAELAAELVTAALDLDVLAAVVAIALVAAVVAEHAPLDLDDLDVLAAVVAIALVRWSRTWWSPSSPVAVVVAVAVVADPVLPECEPHRRRQLGPDPGRSQVIDLIRVRFGASLGQPQERCALAQG